MQSTEASPSNLNHFKINMITLENDDHTNPFKLY